MYGWLVSFKMIKFVDRCKLFTIVFIVQTVVKKVICRTFYPVININIQARKEVSGEI
jgi:hypothetical protein